MTGTVQGVGFRPFVHRLATSLGLAGSVRNTAAGVVIEVVGAPEALDDFVRRLRSEAPPLARITSVVVTELPSVARTGFHVIESAPGARPTALIPPDVALCADCARELAEPTDRRFRYAFTNCTNCGPRFTIVEGIPYDRAQTTMAAFVMCPDCAAEYANPADRRFHAEPVACPRCGPQLILDGKPAPDALARVAHYLAAGEIVAIKGLGGYHLACDARNVDAVELLRTRKGRGQKPFAVMVRDLEEARRIAEVTPRAAALLASPESPVVILPARRDSGLAPGLAPGPRTLGLMLPYTPLHRLLLAASPPALVMTSGNLAEEPIVHRDDEAARKLGPLADHLLSHNREIAVPCDDSVVCVAGELVIPVRRARGYVPRVVRVGGKAPPILAVGGYHKSTFCLLRGGEAILSQHLGDLDSAEVLDYFAQAIRHFARLFQVKPEMVAHDLHPGYLSTQWAEEFARANGFPLVAVQHHHAHIASVMAEAGLEGPVIGVAYDGTGYGMDGTVWGGEILLADRRDFRRAAHLQTVPLPGGEAAVLHPARMALSHLMAALGAEEASATVAHLLPETERRVVLCQIEQRINSPLTSSLGRLFDAVGVLLGATSEVTYEGQPAMELEAMAEEVAEAAPYPYALTEDAIEVRPTWRALVADLRAGVSREQIAARFHETIVAFTVAVCRRLREEGAPSEVVLSGGVMQNARLVSRLLVELNAAGFHLSIHQEVPPNDGGISLGQAAIAAARVSA